jgi:N-acyl-D-amino-acid deacylase
MTSAGGMAIVGGVIVADHGRMEPGTVIISGQRIIDIIPPQSALGEIPVLDASGCLVLPGFIDAHVHGETSIFDRELSEIPLRQGVTTYILGQDGCSSAPGSQATLEYMSRYFAPINGQDNNREPRSVQQFLDLVDENAYLNAAFLAPHGNIRMDYIGLDERAPDTTELREMVLAVERALNSGAIGISTGLDYIPSKYGQLDEFKALADPVRSAGGVFVSHMRGYGKRLPKGLRELAVVASSSEVKVHASHLWGTIDEVQSAFAVPELTEADWSFDAYPYKRGSSLLSMTAVPSWMQKGGLQATLRRLEETDSAQKIEDSLEPGAAERLSFSYIAAPEDQELVGMTGEQAAVRRGQTVPELIRDLLLRSELSVGVVMARANFTDADCNFISNHQLHMASSDGIFQGECPHPRGWATFTRFIELYTKQNPINGWAVVAEHLSARAAERFALKERGHIRVGYIADIAVLDPKKIHAAATYDNPKQLSSGMRHVMVNGSLAIYDGVFSPMPAGVAIKL